MSAKKIFWFVMILAVSQSLVACAEETSPGKEPSAASAPRTIKPGETIKITVWKYPDLNSTVIVDPRGHINSAFVGDVLAAGKTVEEVRQIIAQKIDKQYVANPQVDVTIKTPLPTIFVVGEVLKPGSYAYQAGLDPLKAVALAGGLSDFASFKALILRKDASGKDVQIAADIKQLMKANADREQYQLQPGDTVVVKKGWV